jgi:exopolysaccharide production protein ExoY
MHDIEPTLIEVDAPHVRGEVGFASKAASPSELLLITCGRSRAPQPASPAIELAIRVADILGALVLIVLLAPVLILLALAVVLTDPGAPIFAHRRVGRGGKTFPCYKFRTMCMDAEQKLDRLVAENPVLRRQWEQDFKLANDPRVTPLGRILRVVSLDELPQLFNVLAGDMSLVGPRPIVMSEMPRYGRYIAHYLSVRPGLTGIWQVSGRSDTTYHRRVAADVLYVRKRSMMLNFRILWCTTSAVLDQRGAR